MSYFAVVIHDVDDQERYGQEYIPGAMELINKHGGAVVGLAPQLTKVEGEPSAQTGVIIAFPTEDAFKAWYDDPDYAPLRELRHSITSTRTMVGVPEFSM
ncbi:DUF1330 domain-containing protein [Rhodococcoides fascians]|uniref:DUF1330 domain-containing protein n=1 Tax=Rhodococcoides fascians TaxID=1828 RepID=UPI002ACE097D|nr:DUF1330 domain-containing protein [Rhodococcus fascians]WQH28799.1 DUF1330 domain-containing protein [Rhodococcus fascians]